jgi:hypothetical protein
MMLDQNENSEQLALIKKYGFDKPIATQYLYYINDLSPLSLHSKTSPITRKQGKYNAAPLFSFSNLNLVIKTPYLRESFQKSGKSEIIGNTLPSTAILAFCNCDCYCFRNTIWNYFSTAQGYLDRPFNCFGKHLGNEYSFLLVLFYLLGYLGLSYISTLI